MEFLARAAGLTIGIDAANLRQGGGLTHLIELLREADPARHGIGRVVVWGGSATLGAIADRPWIERVVVPELDCGFLRRTYWQRRHLSAAARATACGLLFVPGGSYAGNFHPVVTMSRNMLPFEMGELLRYGWSTTTMRLLLLRQAQGRSYRQAEGVIFLTAHAQSSVLAVTGPLPGEVTTIPHGVSPRFVVAPRPQRTIADYSPEQPYRLLYVSIIDQYKHQWHVVDAVAKVRRRTGLPLRLDLVGPSYPPALRRLRRRIAACDPDGAWVTYHGPVPYGELHQMYAQTDLGVFASSCENMPNILVETMSAGLPLICSARGPMPDILGPEGAYVDPEDSEDIARILEALIAAPEDRARRAAASFARASTYSWQRCADETFAFLARVATKAGTHPFPCVAS